MSERRACRVIDADRKSVRYRSTRDDDAGLREKLRELANQRRRFGYRRLHILLRREGVMINRKKTQRLYQEEGLAVRRRRSRRRAVGTRAPAPVLALPNQPWSLDFVHDQMASGRRFRVLNVVDDVTRECLVAVPDTSISGRRVVRELTELIARRGKPGMIVSDNGTELTSNAVLAWCGEIGPLLPPEHGRGCRPAQDNRLYLEGMVWIARTGAQWRHLPDEYGKWNSVFRRYRRWVTTGVFDAMLETLAELAGRDTAADMIDSTVIRAHHCAVGIKRGLSGTVRSFVREVGFIHQRMNLSPKIIANWVLASVHSRGGRFHSSAA
jgi:transposase InsO family protein